MKLRVPRSHCLTVQLCMSSSLMLEHSYLKQVKKMSFKKNPTNMAADNTVTPGIIKGCVLYFPSLNCDDRRKPFTHIINPYTCAPITGRRNRYHPKQNKKTCFHFPPPFHYLILMASTAQSSSSLTSPWPW